MGTDTAPTPDRPITGHPDGLSRRGFLTAALGAAGAATVGTTWFADLAGAATPISATDKVLLVITLGGGNDGLNTLVPRSGPLRGPYEQLRGGIALAAEDLLAFEGDHGLHPSLAGLAARAARGEVAVVQGVGQTTTQDLSHFTSMASIMAGTAGTARTSGWVGRFLDGLPEWDSGFRGAMLGSSVPLHLVGTRAKVTAVPTGGGVWGAGTIERWEQAVLDGVRGMAVPTTGLGAMADRVSSTGRDALAAAQVVGGLLSPDPGWGFVADCTVAGRLLGAGMGTRVVAASFGSFDTHASQLWQHAELLRELDAGIEAFFANLAPDLQSRAAVLVVSEFGRRASLNASQGTDHGAASVSLLVGPGVRGGLHGTHPSLTALDSSGSLAPTVDYRSVYATVLDRWLDADPVEVIGGSYPQLDLFR